MTSQGKPYYGKYRGIVADNLDPLDQGRIQIKVPDVLGDEVSGWALPCLPFSGDGLGFFAVPAKGAKVWVEFEHGDPDYPVWSGGWWGDAKERPTPLLKKADKTVMIKTEGGHSITLDDTPGTGGITLKTSDGLIIKLSSKDGIEINNGQGGIIKLQGPRVSINDNALEVT
jgi:uncharacterized protein involved in type VI secretion and phage assembly